VIKGAFEVECFGIGTGVQIRDYCFMCFIHKFMLLISTVLSRSNSPHSPPKYLQWSERNLHKEVGSEIFMIGYD
jgi:hypothetical protein